MSPSVSDLLSGGISQLCRAQCLAIACLFAGVVAAVLLRGCGAWQAVLAAWAVAEICFAAVVGCILLPEMRSLSKPAARKVRPWDLMQRIKRAIDSIDGLTLHEYLLGWFPSVSAEEKPKRGNVEEFAAWVMFSQDLSKLADQESLEVTRCVDDFLHYYDYSLEDGYDPKFKSVRFTLEPDMKVMHRPLMVYVGTALIRWAGKLMMIMLGFRPLNCDGISYWYYSSNHVAADQPPVLFFHGVGVGFLKYGLLIRTLMKNRSVIAVEQPWISMALHTDVASEDHFISTIKKVLLRHSFDGTASVVGHSYGSLTAAWMVQAMPRAVVDLILLDPVAILLAEPTVVRCFLYNDWSTPMHFAIWALASTELGMAWTLRRNFHWYNQALFREDIEQVRRSLVVLSDSDVIVPSEKIARHLSGASGNVQVMRLPKFHHGQFLLSPSILSRIDIWLNGTRPASQATARLPAGRRFGSGKRGKPRRTLSNLALCRMATVASGALGAQHLMSRYPLREYEYEERQAAR